MIRHRREKKRGDPNKEEGEKKLIEFFFIYMCVIKLGSDAFNMSERSRVIELSCLSLHLLLLVSLFPVYHKLLSWSDNVLKHSVKQPKLLIQPPDYFFEHTYLG